MSLRIIPVLIDWVGTNLWEKTGGLVAYSFKNVIRHKQSANRAIILIAALVTFLILFYSIPYSQIQYNNLSSQYKLGGEAQVIPNNQFLNAQINQSKYNINSLVNTINSNFSSSLRGVTPVVRTFIFSTQGSFQLLFINTSTYLDGSSASLFHLGLKNSLTHDLKILSEHGSDNYTVIAPQNYLTQSNSKIGDILLLSQQNYYDSFNIIDSYTEWPLTSAEQLFGVAPTFVMDISYFYNVLIPKINSKAFQSLSGFNITLTMNFKNGININNITEQISQATFAIVVPAKLSAQNLDSISFLIYTFTLGQININIIISIVISVTILMMFAYMQLIERRKEIFTERALGMKIYETALLFYLESEILLVCGIIIGSIVSVYFIQSLAIFFTNGNQIPKYVVIIPLNLVFSTFVLLIIVSSICSIIPPYYLRKKDIIQSFAYEN